MTALTASATAEHAPDDLVQRLEQLAARHYHHRHPFNLLMHAGRLDAEDLRLWVANRYYYQTRIPIKDSLILAKAEDSAFRRVWVERILEHDGAPRPEPGAAPGGLELWRQLGMSLGLRPRDLALGTALLPAVRAACDEYVEFVRGADLLEAVASSLTEYFAGSLMQVRIDAWLAHYPFIDPTALSYFRRRVERAPVEAQFALSYVCEHARTASDRARCEAAFEKKCNILWRLLDAVYVERRLTRRPHLQRHAWLMKLGQGGAESSDDRPKAPAVVLVPEKALGLNDSAFELISRCDARRTLADIIHDLATDYGLAADSVQMDVASFVAELERRRVLVFEA